MKRKLSMLLVLVLLLSVFAFQTQATGSPSLVISSGAVKAGEDVTLTVTIQDNPGIAAAMLFIYYDTSSFEVDLASGVAAVGKFRTSGGLLVNSIETAKKNGRYEGAAGKDGILALWYNGTGTNVTSDGALLTVTLHAKEDIANGDHTIQVGCSVNDTCNEKGEQVAFTTGSGTVTVSGGSDDKEPEQPVDVPEFTDISGNWAETAIKDAASLGLVEGYLGKFRPDDTMTRAEFVTILWRACGEPTPRKAASFTDLDAGQKWYWDAVAWAEENSVVNGIGNGCFGPTGSVTREQLVTILHRLAGTPVGMEMMLTSIYDSQYTDSGAVSSWAKQAVYWSVYEGIYCGEASEAIGSALAPKAAATRAQIAVMMTRYLEKYE